MSDVKDILGFARPEQKEPSVQDIFNVKKARPTQKKAKKPEGVSREVYALTESGSLPPVVPAPSLNLSGLKSKRTLKNKAVKWKWAPFRNAARSDDLVLCHWAKADEEQTADGYQFVRYNQKIDFFEYTPAQYDQYFAKNAEWTKAQTDELWQLCKRFDLRFGVVQDRLSFDKPLEEIKERYYTIAKKLLDISGADRGEISRHPLTKHPFNKKQERERREQYERLYNRSKEQVDEEAALLVEFKRIEGHIRKNANVKRKGPGRPAAGDGPRKKRKKKKKTSDDEDDDDDDDDDDDEFLKKPPLEEEFEVEAQHEHTPISAKPPKHGKGNGVTTRSALMLAMITPSAKLQKQVDDVLARLEVPIRPIPTARVAQAFTELRQDILQMVELQNEIRAKEYELGLASLMPDYLEIQPELAPQAPPVAAVPSGSFDYVPEPKQKKKTGGSSDRKRK
eukprot:TRINITY_DN274_c0_g4_i1.p1 TRINITY_DN274_c0_g4~~TRINITY_DN274_c0_g4_i1.p1  ORF type:complete len:451 (-),score=201.35 TRINITY_DN274_c0_g4_i1:255-1607(-)